MTRELPSDDEIRESLRRNRPSMFAEYFGCAIVLVCMVAGIAAGVIAVQLFGGINQLNPQHAQPKLVILLLGGGGVAGLGIGVLLTQFLRVMTRSARRRQ